MRNDTISTTQGGYAAPGVTPPRPPPPGSAPAPSTIPRTTRNAPGVTNGQSPWKGVSTPLGQAAGNRYLETANRPPELPPDNTAPGGTASGPGILEQWFNQRVDSSGKPGILEDWFTQRANGSDPGYEYAMRRGIGDINREFASRGGYNSSAALGRISDYTANMGAQRQAQLDQLASGASGEKSTRTTQLDTLATGASNEYRSRLADMFNTAGDIANGRAATSGKYDQAIADAIATGNTAELMMMLNRAGIDQQTAQQFVDFMIAGGKTYAGIKGAGK